MLILIRFAFLTMEKFLNSYPYQIGTFVLSCILALHYFYFYYHWVYTACVPILIKFVFLIRGFLALLKSFISIIFKLSLFFCILNLLKFVLLIYLFFQVFACSMLILIRFAHLTIKKNLNAHNDQMCTFDMLILIRFALLVYIFL